MSDADNGSSRARLDADNYFAIIPEWVVYHDELSDRAVRLYATLARHADRDTHVAYPGRSRLAQLLGCSVDSIDRAIVNLEAAGAIVVTRTFKDGRQIANRYHVITLAPARDGGRTGAAPPGSTGAAPPAAPARPELEPVELEPSELEIPPVAQKRERDLIFEAIVESCYGVVWDGPGSFASLTKREQGMANQAAKELRLVGASPGQITERAQAFVLWVGQRPVPPNLTAHWNRLADGRQKYTPDEIEGWVEDQKRAERRAQARRADERAQRALGDGGTE